MSISVDYSVTPWLITIPKADLTLSSGTKYALTVDTFWELLRNYADSAESAPFPIIYSRIPATASTPSITEVNDLYYELQFEDGAYSVNIVNGNTNIRDVEVKNQVSVNTNNTTGFIDPVFLEAGLFAGAVCINTSIGVSGTGKTGAGGIIGTRQTPSDNIADAKQICLAHGLRTINFMTSYAIDTEDMSAGYAFTADSPFLILTVNPAADVTNCSMFHLTVQGEMDGLNLIEGCRLLDISKVSGMMHKIALAGDVTISGPVIIMESYSNWVGAGYATLNVGSHNVEVRDFHGSFGATGITGGTHSFGITEGRVIISGIGGDVYVRGTPYEIADNSGGAVIIHDQTQSKKLREVWRKAGLDPQNPVTATPTSIVAGDINIAITGDGETTSTATRT